MTIKFCVRCGSTVEIRIPPDDNRPRHICARCGFIHYQNPRMIVGCLPFHGERILLCRRAIEPRYGLWTLPAGFMENQESTEEGAAREAYEEANCQVKIIQPFALASLPIFDQVHLYYLAELSEGRFSAGAETLEARLFHPEEIPWDHIAFASVRWCLENYLEDKQRSCFGFHSTTLML